MFATLPHNVKFIVEIENYTKFALVPGNMELNSGHIKVPPSPLQGGEKHGVVGHKTNDSATGCSGVLSWEIFGSDEKLVVMYSIPYSHDFHSNWIGVGLSSSIPSFYEMYNGIESGFKRKEFYYDVNPVLYQGKQFNVVATCGTDHKPTIVVKLIPKEHEDRHNFEQR